MPTCRLTVLGGFAFAGGDGVDLPLPTRKDRALLAYLALAEGRPQGRDRLAGLLWGDRGETQARDSLRQSLAALRQVFRQARLEPLQTERDTVALDLAEITVDAAEFSHLATADPSSAIRLYGGALLDGFEGLTPDYDAWLAPERERLNGFATQALERIADSAARPAVDADAIRFGRRLLARDGLREPVARAVMRLLARSGDRVEALKVYGACRETLQRELSVTPDARTEALYRDILTDGRSAPDAAPGAVPVPDRPAIAVLPLSNLSGDPSLTSLCDGLTEDMITGLGRFPLLFVIDRHSSMAVAAAATDLAEIGRRLGVGFIVQSSLQRLGGRVRITVRLVNAETRAQIWGGAFDAELADVLELPDRVTGAIVSTLHGRVEHSLVNEARRKPKLAAYECLLGGIKHLRGYGPDDNQLAIALFDRAIALDPDYPLAKAYRAFASVVACGFDTVPDNDLEAALLVISAAVEADSEDGRCHWLLASVYAVLGDQERETRHWRRAIDLNPNDANAIAGYATALAACGQIEESLEHFRLAMRLNPHHPEWYWDELGAAFYVAGRYSDSVEAFNRRARSSNYIRPRYAAALAQLGRLEEAAAAAAELRRLQPDFSIGKLRFRGWKPFDAEHFREGMRKAGLPE